VARTKGKKIRVALWGRQNRSIMVEADATKGATVGKDLQDEDGNIVTLESITNITVTDPRQVFPTLWSLILDIPQKLLGLLALTATGYVYHENDVFSIGSSVGTDWPLHKDFIGPAESLTITADFQYIIDTDFDVQGTLDIEAGSRLVVMGDSDRPFVKEYVAVTESLIIPSRHQLLIAEAFDVEGTLELNGMLAIL
jgi:hypothetical protein